ncbi:MAG: hypothetical protein PHQ34_02655 [Methanothrix sp.]|nr:hypothetical protein [Methanothrix sp.]
MRWPEGRHHPETRYRINDILEDMIAILRRAASSQRESQEAMALLGLQADGQKGMDLNFAESIIEIIQDREDNIWKIIKNKSPIPND